jgi:hypothetical protein
MKKIIYTVLLVLSCALTITSCTEETVAPVADPKTSSAGGALDVGKL